MESPQRILKLPVWEGVLFSPAAGEFRITDDEVFPPQKLKVPLSSSILAKYFSIHAQEGAVVGGVGIEPTEPKHLIYSQVRYLLRDIHPRVRYCGHFVLEKGFKQV